MSTPEYTPEELADLSPEERAAIEDGSEEEHDAGEEDIDLAGEEPEGEDAPAAIDDPADAVDTPEAKDEPAEERPIVEDATPEKAHPSVRLPDEVSQGFKDRLQALNDEYENGDKTLAEMLDERDKINREIYNAEAEAQEQETKQAEWKAAQAAFFVANKHYMENKQRYDDLNACVLAIAQTPAGSMMSNTAVLAKAKKMEEAMSGEAPAVTSENPAGKEKPPKSPAPANPNLGDLPAAAPNETGKANEFSYMDKLTGTAYENALEKMTEAQRDRFLKG